MCIAREKGIYMEIQRDYYLEQLKIRRESLNKILISFAIVVLVFILVSCGNRNDEADFNKYDSIFVDRFSSEDDIESIHVSSLIAYYYEDKYYYVVEYIQDGEAFMYELLYIFRDKSLQNFFSIKDENECYQYVPHDYTEYLTAKNKGVKKIYNRKEIEEMINNFYAGKIVDD